MPSQYFDYLPLLRGFIIAGDRFTEKKTGYTLYNISARIMTTEPAGWFSRWLQAQHFHKVRSKVTWEVVDRPSRWKAFLVRLLVSLLSHGIIMALTVLAADWWGFANVVALITSVLVRCAQVAENQAGIDENIRMAEEEVGENWAKYEKAKAEFEELRQQGKINDEMKTPVRPRDRDHVKAIVVTEDSKAVTINAPGFLMRPALTANPQIPNPIFYLACRILCWISFAVHVISIGMAALHTLIISVVLITVSTVLASYKVGCDDSQILNAIWSKLYHIDYEENEWSCWVTSRLKATVSFYTVEDTQWDPILKEDNVSRTKEVTDKAYFWPWGSWSKKGILTDLEHSTPVQRPRVGPERERRQDLYAWLDLTAEEDELLVAWGLIPHSRE